MAVFKVFDQRCFLDGVDISSKVRSVEIEFSHDGFPMVKLNIVATSVTVTEDAKIMIGTDPK